MLHTPHVHCDSCCLLFSLNTNLIGSLFCVSFSLAPYCFQDEVCKPAQSQSTFSSASVLLDVHNPGRHTAISQESLLIYMLLHMPLLGQPVPSKYSPRPSCFCSAPRAFCFMPCGLSNLTRQDVHENLLLS